VQKEPTTCEYLVDSRLCKAVIEQPEGRQVRKESCKNSSKDYCCYLCGERETCEISCSYLDEPGKLSLETLSKKVDREIKKYEDEIGKLSILHANGKIGEQSFLAAIKTLENKISELKKVRENQSSTLYSGAPLFETEFDDSTDNIEKPTALWYLVPFFFGIIGGLIGYVATKDEDENMAFGLLVFGMLVSIVSAIIILWSWASILSRLF